LLFHLFSPENAGLDRQSVVDAKTPAAASVSNRESPGAGDGNRQSARLSAKNRKNAVVYRKRIGGNQENGDTRPRKSAPQQQGA